MRLTINCSIILQWLLFLLLQIRELMVVVASGRAAGRLRTWRLHVAVLKLILVVSRCVRLLEVVVVVRRSLVVDLDSDSAPMEHGAVAVLAGLLLTLLSHVVNESVAAVPIVLRVWCARKVPPDHGSEPLEVARDVLRRHSEVDSTDEHLVADVLRINQCRIKHIYVLLHVRRYLLI